MSSCARAFVHVCALCFLPGGSAWARQSALQALSNACAAQKSRCTGRAREQSRQRIVRSRSMRMWKECGCSTQRAAPVLPAPGGAPVARRLAGGLHTQKSVETDLSAHACAHTCVQDMMEDEDYEFDYEDSDQVGRSACFCFSCFLRCCASLLLLTGVAARCPRRARARLPYSRRPFLQRCLVGPR